MSELLVSGNTINPTVVVVTEPPTERAYAKQQIMSPACMRVFRENATACGFTREDFVFVNPCPPIPEEAAVSDSRTNVFLDEHRAEFRAIVEPLAQRAGVVIYLGRWAGRQLTGRACKITKARGRIGTVEGIAAPVLPLLSPGQILRRPEHREVFETDFQLAGNLKAAGWNFGRYTETFGNREYRWCMDLEEEIDFDNPPRVVSLDAEWTSPDSIREQGEWRENLWYNGLRVLTIQLSWAEGQAIMVPVDAPYFNNEELRGETTAHLPYLTPRRRVKLLRQLRRLLGDARVSVVGHWLKSDQHALKKLGLRVAKWQHDTAQLAFVVDDNMQSKTLDDCVRRWVPSMAGYADEFNAGVDKARMDEVPHDNMLYYGCGDTDADLRLCKVLVPLARQDRANYRCYTKIQMPALRTFFKVERYGLRMDQGSLLDLVRVAGEVEHEIYENLLSQVPAKLKRRYLDNPDNRNSVPSEVLAFTRPGFLRDVLFGPKREGGRGLRPRVFTKTTRNLPPAERIPSTSSKDHLPYFEHDPFVVDLMDYLKLQKLRSTYIGAPARQTYKGVRLLKRGDRYEKKAQEAIEAIQSIGDIEVRYVPPVVQDSMQDGPEGAEEDYITMPVAAGRELVLDVSGRPWWRDTDDPSGFWRYLSDTSDIHSAFMLHRTVTGRTASSDPNGQNIPKRGKTPRMQELVEAYRRCFVARPGYVLIEADLSQAELRLAAWMAREPTMLRIYAEGGDIHAATAAKILRISIEEFNDLPPKVKKLARFRAKAVNFGFLYGMGAAGFRIYAKVEYGIDVTEREAEQTRDDFFELYGGLQGWHYGMRDFCREHGYVRALHGALRRLPSVDSDDDKIVGGAVRQGINAPIQRFASDLGLIGLNRFADKCPMDYINPYSEQDRMHPVGFIHDAGLVEAREECSLEAMGAIKWYMENPPLLEWFNLEPPMDLISDVKVGVNLQDMEEMPDVQAVRPAWA